MGKLACVRLGGSTEATDVRSCVELTAVGVGRLEGDVQREVEHKGLTVVQTLLRDLGDTLLQALQAEKKVRVRERGMRAVCQETGGAVDARTAVTLLGDLGVFFQTLWGTALV